MNCTNLCTRAVLALLFLLSAPSVSLATENGQQSYPIGSNTVLNGLIPSPGHTQLYNYTAYYHAGKLAGSRGESAVPGFSADALVNVMRVVHTWDVSSTSFEFASGIVMPLVQTKLNVPIGNDTRRGGWRCCIARTVCRIQTTRFGPIFISGI